MSQTITAIELIRRSMLLINAIAAGETPVDGDLNDALITLNELFDSWDLQPMAVYSSPNENWVLTPGQAVYDWGITAGAGMFTSERPVFINNVTCVRAGLSTPVVVLSQDEYDSISLKTTSRPVIERIRYVNSFPLGQITCYPVPTEAITLNFNVNRQLAGPVSLQSALALPPGYMRAIRYNLAVELWPEYVNASTDINSIKMIARESFGKVKISNTEDTPSSFDDVPGVGGGGRNWDWRAM